MRVLTAKECHSVNLQRLRSSQSASTNTFSTPTRRRVPAITGQASRVACLPEGRRHPRGLGAGPACPPPHLLAGVGDLRERETAFRSLAEQMDTSTPRGELLLFILGALAQQKRALTRERVLVGLAAAGGAGARVAG